MSPAKTKQSRIEHLTRVLKLLDDENREIRARLELREKRYKKLKKILFVASAPWLILFAPITVPWAVVTIVKNHRRKTKQTEHQQYRSIDQDSNRVLHAFWWLQALGLDEAIAKLDEDPVSPPKGTKSLFEAYEATEDTDWLEATNAWLAHQSDCRIKLAPGDASRFERLRFAEIAPVVAEQRISVIMPAFNAERWIQLSVGSILNQSWQNLELIVVNDKSTDGTGVILDALAKNDTRLRVLHNPVNVGPYVSKNVALSIATGDYITGHDADDIALPDRLERQVRHLVCDPQVSGVIGQMVRVDETGSLSVATRVSEMSFDGIHRTAMISLMVRRDVIDRFGYWDCVRFGADSEFRARLSAQLGKSVKTVNDLTMICLSAPESLTNDPNYGLNTAGGMSQIRVTYKDNWLAWHRSNGNAEMHRVFSNANRPFEAPSEMLVPQADIEALQAHYNAMKHPQ